MKIRNWLAIASVVMATLGVGYFVNADGRVVKDVPEHQAVSQKPDITIDEALIIARKYLETEKVDVSKSHISSAVFTIDRRRDPTMYWAIRWDRDVQVKGGYIIMHIYMDKSVKAFFGE